MGNELETESVVTKQIYSCIYKFNFRTIPNIHDDKQTIFP